MSREREPNIGVLIQNYNLWELIVMSTYYDITHGAASQISKKGIFCFIGLNFNIFCCYVLHVLKKTSEISQGLCDPTVSTPN